MSNAGVNDWYVILMVVRLRKKHVQCYDPTGQSRFDTHQLPDEAPHLLRGEADRVRGEVAVVVVQVDVVPHDLERDARLAHAPHLRARVLDRGVAPAAELEAEPPERLPGRQPDERAVLLDDVLRARAGEEVQVERAAEEPVLEDGDGRRGRCQEEGVRARSAGGEVSLDSPITMRMASNLNRKTPWDRDVLVFSL